ncbi:MAG: RNA methyltransferase, partial [Verrucomicrobiae bacterium]|nr:RNA methyltransferase [Verrucomicrobiae bacterium]
RELRLMAALFGNARPLKTVLDGLPRSPESATILIGPEGDFTPAELSLAVNAGYQPLSLGPIILRSETAAIYAVSILSYELR